MRIVFPAFVKHFGLTEVRVIQNERHRFAPLRAAKAEGIRMSAIYFEAGVSDLQRQLVCAAGFCTLMFSEDPIWPMPELPRHVVCRIRDDATGFIYMLTDFWDHVEFGKNFMLEVMHV